MDRYSQAASRVREKLPTEPGPRDFVRFATLAANSHNTQPWKFRITRDSVDILPDFARRTPVVDPDDHHLYVTLGCAVENLLIAANANGRAATATVQNDDADTSIRVDLNRGPETDRTLCDAIPRRQSTKSDYDGTPLSDAEWRALEKSAAHEGVMALFIKDRARIDQALEFIQAGNSAQMDNPDFVNELMSWIRFSTKTSIKTGDGLSGPPAGNPNLPDWLGPILFRLTFKKNKENDKLARQLGSSAGLVIFVAEDESPEGWIKVGRSFERFALQATALGLCHAHVNMPVEEPAVRPGFAKWLGIAGRRPDLVIRVGRSEPMPMSLRRPLDDVILA